ncbi:MAG TPA: hypothetical protein VNL98_08060 [Gemmatimonadales bacterium]|nr:hypothetical protein [Gemmatimonadales bacterium]
MKRLALVLCLAVGTARAQTEVELRASTTEYRYIEVSHTLPNGIVADGLYWGDQVLDELWVGGGYYFDVTGWLGALPMVYATFGTEGRGVSLGMWVTIDGGGWNARGYLGRFMPTSGSLASYTELDGFEATRAVQGSRWGVGVAADGWRSADESYWLLGPALRRADRRGAWSAWLRFGDDTELRLVRSHSF